MMSETPDPGDPYAADENEEPRPRRAKAPPAKLRMVAAIPPTESERKRGSLWYRRLEHAVANQGQWFCVEMGSPSTARNVVGNLRRGKMTLPNADYRWEFRSSADKVYFRYLGGKK
jgi:hypothetical protein